MNCFMLCLFLAAFIGAAGKIYLTTCARMDVPVMSKVARAACITSCSAQNCPTGHCQKRGGRKTCVCSRCPRGGNLPLSELLKLAGKKGRK